MIKEQGSKSILSDKLKGNKAGKQRKKRRKKRGKNSPAIYKQTSNASQCCHRVSKRCCHRVSAPSKRRFSEPLLWPRVIHRHPVTSGFIEQAPAIYCIRLCSSCQLDALFSSVFSDFSLVLGELFSCNLLLFLFCLCLFLIGLFLFLFFMDLLILILSVD